jgi:autophagy-related protein 2
MTPVSNVALFYQRLRTIVKIPPRFELKEAVIGTLTITLPADLLLSGAVEILIHDVQLAVEVTPPPPEDASESTPSPPSTPRPGDKIALDPEEFPATAEDLAQSFLHAQSPAEKQQLMSLYAETPMDASIMSSSTASVDDDDDLGVGTSVGLPGMLANMFKGIADRMVVRVLSVKVSLGATLPEGKGGERVLLEVEVDEIDIEGVSRNVSSSTSGWKDAREKPQKEGKRRITLENIQGYITATETLFGENRGEESVLFGAASEAATEKETPDATQPSEEPIESVSHATRQPPPEAHLPALRKSSPAARSPSPRPPISPSHFPQPGPAAPYDSDGGDDVDLQKNVCEQEDRFTDFDDSDEEVLAFVRPSMRASTRPPLPKSPSVLPENYFDEYAADEDSDDEVEGGAMFMPSIPAERRSPSPSVLSAGSSSFASPATSPPTAQSFVEPTRRSVSPDIPSSASSDVDSSGDEMDQEASRMLSQSTIFSREEADSLYMSATSGMLRSQSELRIHSHDGRDDEVEEIDAEEMDQRLDRLINGDLPLPKRSPLPPVAEDGRPETPKPPAMPNATPRLIRKKCIDVDLITIYYPSLSAGVAIVPKDETQARDRPEENRGFSQQDMPGAFSTYASRYVPRSPPASSFSLPHRPPPPSSSSSLPHRTAPRVKIVDSVDARPTAPSIAELSDFAFSGVADIEIIASNIHGTVDIHTEKMLAHLLEAVQTVLAEQDTETPKKKGKSQSEEGGKKTVALVAEEIDVRMIKHLAGFYTDNQEEDVGDETIQLQCLLNDVRLFRRGLDEDASTNKLSVKKFALKDEAEGIITFLRSAPLPGSSAKMSTSHHRKRSSASSSTGRLPGHGAGNGPGNDDDITVIFSQSASKVRVNVKTLPLRIRGDLKRLEETFSAFGGVGSVLASTTASTATIGKAGRPPPWPENESAPPGVDTKVHCELGGLVFDVVGTSAEVKLETSPVKVAFQSGKGVTIGIDKISIFGPNPGRKDVRLSIEGTNMEFASRPTVDDLGRLLELLTPSKDRFDDDDILIDTLLRQREQGSVLRINVAGVRGELLDTNIFDALKGLGDEIIQVLTVTDFVAGDERPGLLTLVNVEGVYAYAQIGGGVGLLEAEMDSVGITHVSAPSLVAMAIGNLSIRRNEEELLGEGIDKRIFTGSQHDRPMVMVRMVGDELEPVVRIKLWNIRAEYSVKTLMSMMESPSGTTGEELAQEMVESIIALPQKKEAIDGTGVLGFDVAITDSVLALNPLDLKSRGLIILTNARLQAALPTGGTVSAGMEIKKASIMVIDDVEHLLPAEPGQMRGRKEVLSDHLAGFVSMGYVPMVTVSSAMATLQVFLFHFIHQYDMQPFG